MARTSPVVLAVLAMVAAVVVLVPLLAGIGDCDEPGWSSDGITLNTSSWKPVEGAGFMEMGIVGTVRVASKGCVFLEGLRSDVVLNVAWPADYTAERQPNGTVNIRDTDVLPPLRK